MLEATQGKQIEIRVPNAIGTVAKLSKVVADKGINILAMACSVEGTEGVICLVTEDNLRATDALTEGGYQPQETDVVLVAAHHKPGILRHLADRLATENVDIKHLYASATISQDVCLCVLDTSNNERAMVLLNEPQT